MYRQYVDTLMIY